MVLLSVLPKNDYAIAAMLFIDIDGDCLSWSRLAITCRSAYGICLWTYFGRNPLVGVLWRQRAVAWAAMILARKGWHRWDNLDGNVWCGAPVQACHHKMWLPPIQRDINGFMLHKSYPSSDPQNMIGEFLEGRYSSKINYLATCSEVCAAKSAELVASINAVPRSLRYGVLLAVHRHRLRLTKRQRLRVTAVKSSLPKSLAAEKNGPQSKKCQVPVGFQVPPLMKMAPKQMPIKPQPWKLSGSTKRQRRWGKTSIHGTES